MFFKSVFLFNRFKKLKFLASKREKGENQKKKALQGGNLQEIFSRGNAKHVHLAGGKDLLTLNVIMYQHKD
jgi:hypothetical protein